MYKTAIQNDELLLEYGNDMIHVAITTYANDIVVLMEQSLKSFPIENPKIIPKRIFNAYGKFALFYTKDTLKGASMKPKTLQNSVSKRGTRGCEISLVILDVLMCWHAEAVRSAFRVR